MNKKFIFLLSIGIIFLSNCNTKNSKSEKIRSVVDTVGFASYGWQMDSIIHRINYSENTDETWRLVIAPHDDYAYVGNLYPKVLNGIKAKTIILFGVAHKAKNYNLENKIVFDSFDAWKALYGNVKVSELRNTIISKLSDSLFVIHDEMQSVEHSIEAIIPFLQYQNRDIEIIPILVPYMLYDNMKKISMSLSNVISEIMKEKNIQWGKDIAIVITTDAVHYGDEDWGDKNYAPFGTDSIGLANARNHEMEIISNCLLDEVNTDKIQQFVKYTVSESDYKEYKWTWCGRYSIPFGLLTAYNLDKQINGGGLKGSFIGYSNSIDHPILKVDDLQMGTTAPANNRHWVGYAAVGYQ